MIYLVKPGQKQREELSKPLRQGRFLVRLLGIFVICCMVLGILLQIFISRFEARGRIVLLQQMRVQQLAGQAMIDFRWLVQEWKNTLLRGHKPEHFQAYWSALQRKRLEILEAGRELQSLSQGRQLELISLTIRNMEELIVQYEKALAQARTGHAFDPFQADALVQGRDRKVLDPLNEYLIGIQLEQKSGIEKHFKFIGLLQLSLMIGFCLILIICYALGRREFLKWASREDLLEAQNSKMRSLGRLSANIIHEIKNPITIIDGRCQMILSLLQKKEQVPIDKIEESVHSMQKVNDRVVRIIQTLSKLSRHAHDLDYVPVAPRLLLDEVDSIVKSRFWETRTELEWIVPDDLPEIMGREIEISQVLINLLLNSLDAIQSLDHKWVRLEIKEEGEFLVFIIVDSGSGIPLDIVRKISRESFTSKAQGKGTGQGMQITKRIIREHQGYFAYDDTSAHTCFRVGLPLVKSTDRHRAQAA